MGLAGPGDLVRCPAGRRPNRPDGAVDLIPCQEGTMPGTDGRWDAVEGVVRQEPADPDGFRVVFERAGPRGRVRLAVVEVAGTDDPVVTGFTPGSGAGFDRAEFERQAVAAVRSLADALADS